MSLAKQVFYVNYFGQPVFRERLEAQGITLVGLAPDAAPAERQRILATSQVYQVSSGVNDLPASLLAQAALLDQAPQLVLVSTVGAGYDTVDVAACTARGILVLNQSGGGNAQAVAEHTLAMMLCLSKRIIQSDRRMRRADGVSRHAFTGNNLQGKTLGIIGFGHVGQRLAAICQAGLQMRILATRSRQPRALPAGPAADQGVTFLALHDMLPQCDVVAVCCALTPETHHLIGAREFALMPAHAWFVTAARGGIHDEAALVAALEQGRIAGAGVDVWDTEPPPHDHPLLQRDDVIASPHIGGATVESRLEASATAARRIAQVLAGQWPERPLNPEVWPAYRERFRAVFGHEPAPPSDEPGGVPRQVD